MIKREIRQREDDEEPCPACGGIRASRIRTNPTPVRNRFSHPDVPKQLVPIASRDVQCWTCGERSTIVNYEQPQSL